MVSCSLPAIESVILKIDVDAHRIHVQVPDGLIPTPQGAGPTRPQSGKKSNARGG